MQTITLLAMALFTADCATPLVIGSGGLSSSDSSMPAPGNILADAFQIPSDQSISPDQPLNSGDHVVPTTDIQAASQTKLDDHDNPEKPTVQVASAAASSSDAKVNLFDPLDIDPSITDSSNTDQYKSTTSLDLPPSSPNSNINHESTTNLVTSDDHPTKATSASETACVDSSTGSESKVRRRGLGDMFNSIKEHFWPAQCPVNQDTTEDTTAPAAVPSLLPKPNRPSPIPDPNPEPSPREPIKRPLGPKVNTLGEYNPTIDGGRYFGGSASCDQRWPDALKVYTVVCAGPVTWEANVWMSLNVAKIVENCRYPGSFGLTFIMNIWCCKEFWVDLDLGKMCKELFVPLPNY